MTVGGEAFEWNSGNRKICCITTGRPSSGHGKPRRSPAVSAPPVRRVPGRPICAVRCSRIRRNGASTGPTRSCRAPATPTAPSRMNRCPTTTRGLTDHAASRAGLGRHGWAALPSGSQSDGAPLGSGSGTVLHRWHKANRPLLMSDGCSLVRMAAEAVYQAYGRLWRSQAGRKARRRAGGFVPCAPRNGEIPARANRARTVSRVSSFRMAGTQPYRRVSLCGAGSSWVLNCEVPHAASR